MIFGDISSVGSRLTEQYCLKHKKIYFCIKSFSDNEVFELFENLQNLGKIVINIAGNRESKYPGIEHKTRIFLEKLFTLLEDRLQ